MIVIEAIPRFFNLTPQQTRELDQMPLAQDRLRWLRENLQTLLNQGVHKDLFADVNTAFSRNETSITASPEQMEKIGKETIAMMAMKRSELRGGAVKTFLYQAQVARDLLKEKGLGFVLGVILGINKEAAWLDLIAAKAVIRQMIDGLDAFVEAHKDRELNLGFMMAFDPQLKEEFVALAQKIQSLKQVPGNKINNKLEVIFTSEQTIENREAFEAIQRAGAKAKVKGKNRDFMLDSSVFAYGVEVPVGSDLKHLVVEAGVYSMRVVFPAALALNMHTAADGKIEADSLRVPQDLATVFGMAGRSLRILDGVLEAKWLEIAAQRIILSAA